MKTSHHVMYLRLRSQTTNKWLVDPKLRPSLVRDAKKAKTTLTDVIAEILSERYGYEYTPTGRTTMPRANEAVMNVRLPTALWDRVRRAAMRAGRRDMDEVRVVLCEHYGLKVP